MNDLSRHDRKTAKSVGALMPLGLATRTAQTAILVAALFSFLCQTFLAQAHHHPRTSASANFTVGPSLQVGIRSGQPTGDQPIDCSICYELGHASAYILPGTITFATPHRAAIWVGAMPSLGSALVERSHAWRSRAPPLHLQA